MSWSSLVTLVEKVDDHELRAWYADAAAGNAWSSRVLLNQIENQTHLRVGAAPSNLTHTIPSADNDLAPEVTKDPYVFEFLGLVGRISERELEDALVHQIQATLGPAQVMEVVLRGRASVKAGRRRAAPRRTIPRR